MIIIIIYLNYYTNQTTLTNGNIMCRFQFMKNHEKQVQKDNTT